MSAVDEACAAIVARVEDAWAAAVVLVDSGEVVGAHVTREEAGPQAMAAVARNTLGPVVRALHLREGGGAFDEIYVATKRSSQFAKAVHGGRALLVVATRRLSNVGLGWTQVRECAPAVESLSF